ncbi:hypothetical protein F2P56_015608 [Juglans regia]|uniref:Uncharacterized protein n=1 Tax=Juglans regia TaxID=51240 RepID=A0A834CN21_JUGRE|nr:hypothetical protein F2P56_015608 [Juglans regia]
MRKDFTKVSELLVRVLRLVDGEEKPAMGYLYDAMERAKENIKARCNNKVSVFNPFIRIINARWDKQLHSPLHAAGCFLNPAIYYNPCFKNKNDVARGFMACVMRIELDIDNQDKIIEELELYKNAEGDFGHSLAIRQRDKINLDSELIDGEDLDWASIEKPLSSLNLEDGDDDGDVDGDGDVDENIMNNISNVDHYCLFYENE